MPGFFRAIAYALVVTGLAMSVPQISLAQGCGQSNPNCIVPTAPNSTSNNQAASTAFVHNVTAGFAPGGSSGQVQFNNAGAFGGLTNAQVTALINPASASLSGALPPFPGNTTTYFRGDGTYVLLNAAALGGLGTGVATALGNPLNATGGLVGFGGNIGAATGTSLALGGASIGSNALAVNGATDFGVTGIPNYANISVFQFGASPSNTAAANTTAINAIEALSGGPFAMYVPPGHYATNFTPFEVTNQKYLGPGQFVMSGFAQAAQRSFILTPQPIPSTDRTKMFDVLCKYQFDCQYHFVGPGTTTTQAGGYQNFLELSSNIRVSESAAGFNSGTAGVGPNRSGQFQNFEAAYFGGGGDYTIDSYFGSMYGGCPVGATHFFACPALAIHNGGVGPSSTAANGGYLQGREIIFNDMTGASMSAIADVFDMVRTQTDKTLGQVWGGPRIQSGGSATVDFGYACAGGFKSCYDTTMTTLDANKVAEAIKDCDRIYLAASSTPDSQGVKWYADTPGTSWISSCSDNIGFFVKGFNSLNVQGATGALVNGITVIGQTTTVAPQIVANGTDTNIGMQFSLKGTGQAFFTNPAGFMFVPSGNDTLLAGSLAQTVTNKTISGASNTITNIGNASLSNSSFTVNGVTISLGASGTVTAAAGTLTGPTLASTVVNSSLANAAAAFTAGALVTSSAGIQVNGFINSNGSILSGGFIRPGAGTFAAAGTCAGPSDEGKLVAVTDSTTNTWGATATGGGTNHALLYCDGTTFSVAAK